jgi:hypothetical protein
MTNEVSTRKNDGKLIQLDPATIADNLTRIGDELQAKSWIGALLRFEHGQWKSGTAQATKVIPIGTHLTAVLESVEIGWQRWVERSLVSAKTGLVCEGFQMPTRNDLGDMDTTLWPRDPVTGQSKDPWQKSARVVLYGAKGDAGMLFTFATTSRGGLDAVGALCKLAGKELRAHPGASPVVALRAGGYTHKKLGTWVDTPAFELVGWNETSWEGAAVRKED